MSPKNQLGETAVRHFREGFNCAQSVLLAMSEYGKDKNELIPKIATGFGAGIGRCGSLCGALAGGVMVIGIKCGTDEPSPKKRQKSYSLAQKLYKQFESRHGSVLCRKLTGYDLSNPQDLRKARKARVFEEKCPTLIRCVVEILAGLFEH